MSVQLNAEGILPETMAARYKHLDESNWSQMAKQLESLLELKDIKDISQQSLFDCLCILERIKTIEWQKEKKQEVADFLLDTAIKMFDKKDYLDSWFNIPPNSSRKVSNIVLLESKTSLDLLFSMIEKHGYLSETLRTDKLNKIWNEYANKNASASGGLRDSVLISVSEQMRFSESVGLLRKWLNRSSHILTKQQKDYIENDLIPMHEYAFPDDESEAIDIFLKQVIPSPAEKILTLPYSRFLSGKIDNFKIARRNLTREILLNKAEKTNDFYKRYITIQIALSIGTFDLDFPRREHYYNSLKSFIDPMSEKIKKEGVEKNIEDFLDCNKKHIDYFVDHLKSMQPQDKRTPQNKTTNVSDKIPPPKAKHTITITVICPEDQGEDFSLFDNAENFKRLTTAEDKYERWKAAKVLGTRFIDGKYKPTQDEQKKIDEYVAFLLTQYNTDNPGDAGDATDQLWRLWSLAIPGLLQGLKDKDRTTWNAALEHLVILRNENIVETLIKEYDKVEDEDYKRVLLDALGKMRTKYDNRFPYRKMMNSKKSAELANKLITPFLDRISATEKVERLQNAIKEAKTFIAKPIDSRSLYVDPTTGTEKPVVDEDLENEQKPNSQISETSSEPSP